MGLALPVNTFALIRNPCEINQLNADGKKEWFRKEETGEQAKELYYHTGLRNGTYKEYYNGKLYYFGEYRNDTMTGRWYYFDDFGGLVGIQKDSQKKR